MARNFLSLLLLSALAFASADDPEKLVGAQDASPGQFSYTVSLRVSNSHICGGSIISNYHILTAAHCVKALQEYGNDISVVTGSIYLNNGGVAYSVASMFAHPNYGGENNWANDVGVIKLAEPITFNEFQTQIALPTANPPADTYAVISAWGDTSSPPYGTLSNTLQYLFLRMISLNECAAARDLILQSNVICTYDGVGVGLCPGDSGSPLVYEGQIVGVVSRGIPCARGIPDVFTNVYDTLPFISEAMQY